MWADVMEKSVLPCAALGMKMLEMPASSLLCWHSLAWLPCWEGVQGQVPLPVAVAECRQSFPALARGPRAANRALGSVSGELSPGDTTVQEAQGEEAARAGWGW